MAISVAQGTVTLLGTDVATTTKDITTDGAGNALTGFHTAAARVVIFRASGNNATGFTGGNSRWNGGFATSASSRRAYATCSANGAADSRAFRHWRTDCCILDLNTGFGSTGELGGAADYNGEITNGFQLIIDDQFSGDRHVSWLAIWGDELSVAIHDFTSPAATGNQDYSVGLALNTGLDNKAVIFLGGVDGAVDTGSPDAYHMLGIAAGDTPANAVLFTGEEDNLGTTDTWSYCKSGECIAVSNALNAIAERASLTQWNSDGFRLNWSEVNGTVGLIRYSALVLKGPQFAVGDILSRTDTTQTDEVVGFAPLGLMFFSHSRAESASDTTDTTAQGVVGFATSASSRSVQVYTSEDAVATTNVDMYNGTTEFYASLPVAVPSAIDALMDLVDMTVGGGGFTYVMDDTEAAAAFIPYLAVGAAIAAAARPALIGGKLTNSLLLGGLVR